MPIAPPSCLSQRVESSQIANDTCKINVHASLNELRAQAQYSLVGALQTILECFQYLGAMHRAHAGTEMNKMHRWVYPSPTEAENLSCIVLCVDNDQAASMFRDRSPGQVSHLAACPNALRVIRNHVAT